MVLRDETERPEAVDAGCALLIGATRAVIISETMRLLNDAAAYTRMSQTGNPFGDGQASRRTVDVLALNLAGALENADTAAGIDLHAEAEATTESA